MSHNIHRVAIAGGAGTRLWPLSRQARPKQFLCLGGSRPLIEETLARVGELGAVERQWLVVGEAHAELCAELLPTVPRENILAEPKGLNTAAAIALAAYHIRARDPDGVMAVFPADHHVGDPAALRLAVAAAAEMAAEGRIVTLGVTPTVADTGYGYIETGETLPARAGQAAYAVQRFCEKPDRTTAETFLAAGNFLWNAGMFIMRADVFLGEYKEQLATQEGYLAQIAPLLQAAGGGSLSPAYTETLRQAYARMRPISVDYGVMEGAANLAVVPLSCGWCDVGSLSALGPLAPHQDAHANASNTQTVVLGGKDNILWTDSPGHVMAVVGMDDIIVINTKVATLVLRRDDDQSVRDVVAALRESGAIEAL